MKTMSEKNGYCQRMSFDAAQTALFHLGCAYQESGLCKKEYNARRKSIMASNYGISKLYLNQLSRKVFEQVMLTGEGVESFDEFNKLIQPQLENWKMDGKATRLDVMRGIYFDPLNC
ncbi:hypothetical protein [Eubacterium limosum]|uniref:hypothetical protein n=1 Tax=Eubacterium limosum TaxID=1736 RepID=UPI00371BB75A